MRISRKTAVAALTLNALQGRLTSLPTGTVKDVLNSMEDMGGVHLAESADEIVRKALQFCDESSRISHVIVNRVYGDIQISLIIDTEEYPVKTERDILNCNGVLAYVFNNSYPYDSELGYVFFEKRKDRFIHRIG